MSQRYRYLDEDKQDDAGAGGCRLGTRPEVRARRRRRARKRRLRKIRNRIIRFGSILCILAVLAGGSKVMGRMTGRFSGAETVSVEKLKEEDYPQSLRQLYDKNVEARQFVLDYKNKKDVHDKIDVSNEVTSGEIPLFIQWDERWGYEQYGDDFLAVTGCGPTSLSMVYIGLTGDTSLHPLAMARLAEKEGYYVNGSGSSWSMMTDLAKKLGLTVRNVVFDEGHILDELRDGNPIICIMGPGDFTTAGHFIVLTGIADNGEIEIHDPNSIRNSDRTWRLDVLMRQTRNLWGYSG